MDSTPSLILYWSHFCGDCGGSLHVTEIHLLILARNALFTVGSHILL